MVESVPNEPKISVFWWCYFQDIGCERSIWCPGCNAGDPCPLRNTEAACFEHLGSRSEGYIAVSLGGPELEVSVNAALAMTASSSVKLPPMSGITCFTVLGVSDMVRAAGCVTFTEAALSVKGLVLPGAPPRRPPELSLLLTTFFPAFWPTTPQGTISMLAAGLRQFPASSPPTHYYCPFDLL